MRVEDFTNSIGAGFYAGVPDSQLKALCDYLVHTYGAHGDRHIIAANEGNALAIAAGYHLATGKIPLVYMQNSGEGNIINPLASLTNEKVYAIPCVLVIGWRGEPGVKDEPQHIYQGEVTCKLLEDMGIEYCILSKDTTTKQLEAQMEKFRGRLSAWRCVAIVVRKGALVYEKEIHYRNQNSITREEAIRHILSASGDDPVISTTGKASRELFEIREANGEGHSSDFLTVGSMGHCSSIALGVALHQPEKTIWCIDGDGAALMHMGAMPVIAHCRPKNLIHIIINNGAHETVGGQPTVMEGRSFEEIAKACGYPHSISVSDIKDLDKELAAAKSRKDLTMLEIKCGLGARPDLGRPTTSALENKQMFIKALKNEQIVDKK